MNEFVNSDIAALEWYDMHLSPLIGYFTIIDNKISYVSHNLINNNFKGGVWIPFSSKSNIIVYSNLKLWACDNNVKINFNLTTMDLKLMIGDNDKFFRSLKDYTNIAATLLAR